MTEVAEKLPWLPKSDKRFLITGAKGFIGKRVVSRLLELGYSRIRCLIRPSLSPVRTNVFPGVAENDSRIEIVSGNLLSREDCETIVRDVDVVYHLAAGRGEKSFPSAFQNSVVTTRNLLDACVLQGGIRRFVNVSSFAVYSNRNNPRKRLLDELCPMETDPAIRGSAYCYAKVKQDEMVIDYGSKYGLPYTIVRPGVVYGPGNEQITGRVGTGIFGIFLHMGGSNIIPFSYVDNCADAIVLAGIEEAGDKEIFNIVDDDLPTSRRFLRLYKKNVRRFYSVYMPHAISYVFCGLWERYSDWSGGQLPKSFNRKEWHVFWKRTNYSNRKIKEMLGWEQRIPTRDALTIFFDSCREKVRYA